MATVRERASGEVVPTAALLYTICETALTRISHHQHSAGGAEDPSPGRKPWERGQLSPKPRQGRKKTIAAVKIEFLSPLPGLVSLSSRFPALTCWARVCRPLRGLPW